MQTELRRPRLAVSECPASLRLSTRFFDAASGPADLAPGHGLPESKRGGGRGPVEPRRWVGGAPRPGGRWVAGSRSRRGPPPGSPRPRRARPLGPSPRRERSGALRAAGTAPGDPGWPLPCTWSWARALGGTSEASLFLNHFLQRTSPPLILAASQHAREEFVPSQQMRKPVHMGLPAGAEADALSLALSSPRTLGIIHAFLGREPNLLSTPTFLPTPLHP